MGFDPEFTGRQNAEMGLQLLGVHPSQISTLILWIESFSELGEYFDQPLRTYSSGMQVRLGFSVATAVKPDLLIIDEAMAVGDAYFQHKSTSRIRYLKDQGTSLLFVSHDAASVKALCDRAILLLDGKIIMDDNPVKVMDYYNALIAKQQETMVIEQSDGQTRSGSGLVKVISVEIFDSDGVSTDNFSVSEQVSLKLKLELSEEIQLPTVGISIRDKFGNEVFGTNTFHLGVNDKSKQGPGELEFRFHFPMNIGVGSYSVTVAAHTEDTHLDQNYDWWDQALMFKVLPGEEYRFQGTVFLDINAEYARVG
jgi:lipopolysaccharide transport system ATP-binding protein